MSEPTEPRNQRQDDALAVALKRAADVRDRLAPVPVAHIEALGTRRRRSLAVAAACAVCVLGGTSALVAVQLAPDSRPAAPVVTPTSTPTPSRLTPTPSAPSSPASSPVTPSAGSGPATSPSFSRPPSSGTPSSAATPTRPADRASGTPSAGSGATATTDSAVTSPPTPTAKESAPATALVLPQGS